jgi:hypothetical protein
MSIFFYIFFISLFDEPIHTNICKQSDTRATFRQSTTCAATTSAVWRFSVDWTGQCAVRNSATTSGVLFALSAVLRTNVIVVHSVVPIGASTAVCVRHRNVPISIARSASAVKSVKYAFLGVSFVRPALLRIVTRVLSFIRLNVMLAVLRARCVVVQTSVSGAHTDSLGSLSGAVARTLDVSWHARCAPASPRITVLVVTI